MRGVGVVSNDYMKYTRVQYRVMQPTDVQSHCYFLLRNKYVVCRLCSCVVERYQGGKLLWPHMRCAGMHEERVLCARPTEQSQYAASKRRLAQEALRRCRNCGCQELVVFIPRNDVEDLLMMTFTKPTELIPKSTWRHKLRHIKLHPLLLSSRTLSSCKLPST